MKIFRILVTVLAVVITLFRGFLFVTRSDIDEGPVITCEQQVFELTCHQDVKELLKFVSAYDKQDGKIENVFIESSFYIYNGNRSKVSFVAIDSDSNITKCEREIVYTDYTSPELSMNASGIYLVDEEVDLSGLFSASDTFEGDISSRVKIISEAYKENTVGTFPMKAKVCNVYGDITEIDFNIYVLKQPYPLQIELSEYIVYLPKNQEKPDFRSYVTGFSGSLDEITVDDGALQLDKSGCYEVYYRVGSGQNIQAFNRLVVVVGE